MIDIFEDSRLSFLLQQRRNTDMEKSATGMPSIAPASNKSSAPLDSIRLTVPDVPHTRKEYTDKNTKEVKYIYIQSTDLIMPESRYPKEFDLVCFDAGDMLIPGDYVLNAPKSMYLGGVGGNKLMMGRAVWDRVT